MGNNDDAELGKETLDRDTSVDEIRREYYWLISQRDMCCSLECNGIIVLDYDHDKMNKRIQELGHCLYDLTYGEEGFKN